MKKHCKIMHYEAFTQYLNRNYQVLFLRKDRSTTINAAFILLIVYINPILQHI
jgi:hypothetical protein